MVGVLADYTAAKLDSIKSDLAQMLRIRPDMLSLSAEAAVLPATGVDVSATMPDAAAADFMAKYAREQLMTLGSTQVHLRLNRTLPSDLAVSSAAGWCELPRRLYCVFFGVSGDECDLRRHSDHVDRCRHCPAPYGRQARRLHGSAARRD
jgi:hypothetical protein